MADLREDRQFILLRKSDGTPRQSWWTNIGRKEFRTAAQLAGERMKRSPFGNVAKPITAKE